MVQEKTQEMISERKRNYLYSLTIPCLDANAVVVANMVKCKGGNIMFDSFGQNPFLQFPNGCYQTVVLTIKAVLITTPRQK